MNGSRTIGKGCLLRVIVAGAKNETSHVHFVAATGQMMDDYLGLID